MTLKKLSMVLSWELALALTATAHMFCDTDQNIAPIPHGKNYALRAGMLFEPMIVDQGPTEGGWYRDFPKPKFCHLE